MGVQLIQILEQKVDIGTQCGTALQVHVGVWQTQVVVFTERADRGEGQIKKACLLLTHITCQEYICDLYRAAETDTHKPGVPTITGSSRNPDPVNTRASSTRAIWGQKKSTKVHQASFHPLRPLSKSHVVLSPIRKPGGPTEYVAL